MRLLALGTSVGMHMRITAIVTGQVVAKERTEELRVDQAMI
jgi:hypothetical protein